MLGIEAKDIILLFAGALVALPITAGWQGTKAWLTRRQGDAKRLEEEWRQKLTSADADVRKAAMMDLTVRASYQFVLGNMMFAVSGLAWIADPIASEFGELFPIQGLFAAATSFAALIYFSATLRWLRRLRTAYADM